MAHLMECVETGEVEASENIEDLELPHGLFLRR